jgi:hypothetical protein
MNKKRKKWTKCGLKKYTTQKSAGGVTKEIEHLTSKHEALS